MHTVKTGGRGWIGAVGGAGARSVWEMLVLSLEWSGESGWSACRGEGE